MSGEDDVDNNVNNTVVTTETGRMEKEIDKEIAKLEYYLNPIDELIEGNDLEDIQVTIKQVTKVANKLSDLVSKLEEIKIDNGISAREVRQWKKDLKSKYSKWFEEKGRLSKVLNAKEQQVQAENEREKWRAHQQLEEAMIRERHEQERRLWDEKLKAELEMTEKKLGLERQARATTAKLPKLTITPFKGTIDDWIRFESVFVSQVDKKPISVEEKFGYLLEFVTPKVRNKLSNLKPSAEGYEVAWSRLKTEYGQTKQVINAHMEEIIKLPVVRGSNYARIQEFHDHLARNFDALKTLGEDAMLRGLVVSTLNKPPMVKPDLVRLDESWEEWDMKGLLDALQSWLKRNKSEEMHGGKEHEQTKKRERNWYTQGGSPKNTGPVFLFCEGTHWGDQCTSYNSISKRRQFLLRKDCVLIADHLAIAKTNAEVEGVSSAKENITLVFVIKPVTMVKNPNKVVINLITTQC